MKSGLKIWSTIVDYFLILGAIIGVGFASGKEICVFFFDFGSASLFGLVAFGLLYVYLFTVVGHIGKKLELNSYDKFNQMIFGNLPKILIKPKTKTIRPSTANPVIPQPVFSSKNISLFNNANMPKGNTNKTICNNLTKIYLNHEPM